MRDYGLAPRAGADNRMVRGGYRRQWLLSDRGMPQSDRRRNKASRAQAPVSGRNQFAPGAGGALGDATLALRARRATELGAVTAREMRRGLKAAGGRDVNDRHRGLQQQLARAAQAHLQVVAFGHAVQV